MTMFPMLDDPHPPVATHHTLTRVHTRARILRRRRRMVAATPALLAVGVAGAIVPRLRSDSPEEIATITSSTLPPTTGVGLPTTTLPFDARGEVFALAAAPAGWELTQERLLQMPEVRQFERMMAFRRPNNVDPADPDDPFDRFTIYRYEAAVTDVARQRTSVLEGGTLVNTPGGREVVVHGDGGNLTWFVNDNIYIQINSNPAHGLDVVSVIDSLEYTAPSPSCFDGDVVRTELSACGAVEYETP